MARSRCGRCENCADRRHLTQRESLRRTGGFQPRSFIGSSTSLRTSSGLHKSQMPREGSIYLRESSPCPSATLWSKTAHHGRARSCCLISAFSCKSSTRQFTLPQRFTWLSRMDNSACTSLFQRRLPILTAQTRVAEQTRIHCSARFIHSPMFDPEPVNVHDVHTPLTYQALATLKPERERRRT